MINTGNTRDRLCINSAGLEPPFSFNDHQDDTETTKQFAKRKQAFEISKMGIHAKQLRREQTVEKTRRITRTEDDEIPGSRQRGGTKYRNAPLARVHRVL